MSAPARVMAALAALDPRDVFLVGGLGCLFAGIWTIAGAGWALALTGFLCVVIWTVLTLCR
jgi:membrane protein implicated in regulation of membrane protease activity